MVMNTMIEFVVKPPIKPIQAIFIKSFSDTVGRNLANHFLGWKPEGAPQRHHPKKTGLLMGFLTTIIPYENRIKSIKSIKAVYLIEDCGIEGEKGP